MSEKIVLWEAGQERITAEDCGDFWQIVDSVGTEDDGWFSISSYRIEKAWLQKLKEAQT